MNRKTLAKYLILCLIGIVGFLYGLSWLGVIELNKKDAQYFAPDKPEGFVQYFKEITTPIGLSASGYPANYAYNELLKAKNFSKSKKQASTNLLWVQRGPVNVGGRTRCILLDPDDPSKNTWFAGTAGGGIWKTTDAGLSWIDISPDLPNLSTTTLCMAPSDHSVIFAGTGEGYGGEGMITGNGIFVSRDKGGSWQLLESTDQNNDFRFVNKIWIDPLDKNIVIAVTNTAVLKSVDGGVSWKRKFSNGYRVQDIIQNPRNPKVLYAAVNTFGVIKSSNQGETWVHSNAGIGLGYRYALAISPVDTSYVYACIENSTESMDVYLSVDAGGNWLKQRDLSGSFFNFHQAQGWFNSVIEPHPFKRNEVYVAGVYMGLLSFTGNTSPSSPMVLSALTSGTEGFMDFINFGGEFLEGGLSTGLAEGASVTVNDFVSIELRFGPGKHQKAHRFTVPVGSGPGVAKTDYSYQDYVDVPFEAWDTKNNIQLSVSFRDQERDGFFNLIEREADNDIDGREYIFIHAIPYLPFSPSSAITKNGGHYEKMMYFFWPTLAEKQNWNPNDLAESKIKIEFGSALLREMVTTIIQNGSKNTNLHVDHHDLVVIPGASELDPIRLISANDGGVAHSQNGGNTWVQLTNGFITTQFYGASKKPGEHEYVGGLQDNGTWQSPASIEATDKSLYNFRLSGDGFQTLWNNSDPKKILASIYNNRIYSSINSGLSWQSANIGINDDGPFITKLSNSRKNPNLVFAVGAKGIYRHATFGIGKASWKLSPIDEGWTLNRSAYSSSNVKVSQMDSSIVWAGTGMFNSPLLNIFLSRDFGVTYYPVNNYEQVDMGLLSGMATHPFNRAEAFLLFSYRGSPKILRTMDFGQTWNDISGFGTDSLSSNGFPDVIVHDLLVMPTDTNIIWAGTEIGIFETTDNGISWHFLEGNFPAVSVFQLFEQDGQVVAATHGRGIWTASLWPVGIKNTEIAEKTLLKVYPNPVSDFLSFKTEAMQSTMAEVRVISVSGGVLLSLKLPVDGGSSAIQRIDVSDLVPGNYLLNVKIEGASQTAKFSKQ